MTVTKRLIIVNIFPVLGILTMHLRLNSQFGAIIDGQ